MAEWWQRLFDRSYVEIYRFTDDRVERELEFLKDVLDLRPGLRLLDVCCGFGRHAVPLARMGLTVTGVDLSAAQLRQARRRARTAGVEVEWLRADARGFTSRAGRFDRVINLFTSFGYFSEEKEDLKMLSRMTRALKRGGLLCLDTMNRDFLVRHFQPTIVTSFAAGHVIDRNRLDHASGRCVAEREICREGKTRKQQFSVRLYTARELILMAGACGLEVVELHGSLDKQPLSFDTPRIVLIARKR